MMRVTMPLTAHRGRGRRGVLVERVRGGGPGDRLRRGALVAAVAALLLTGCATDTPDAASTTIPTSPPRDPSPAVTAAPEAAPLAVGEAPASVSIPSIEIDEPLIDLGITADGTMEVPDDWDAVGWFTGGGRPGGIGPTVIAGHVDSPTGPAVFLRLTELAAGDRVQVTDVAGTVFDYEVYRVGDYAKKDFPTAEVFGALPTDEVRLITCTGLFDSSIGHYEDNRVVFARPA